MEQLHVMSQVWRSTQMYGICTGKGAFFKVTGYALNNFVGANIYCLEKQPYRVLHLMASSPPSNYCAKNLQTPLIGH